jgi:hypothetical protein
VRHVRFCVLTAVNTETGLLECDATSFNTEAPTSRRNLLPPCSNFPALKMQLVVSSKTTGAYLPNYTAYIPEDRNLHLLGIFNFLLYNVLNVACGSSAVKYDILNALGLGGLRPWHLSRSMFSLLLVRPELCAVSRCRVRLSVGSSPGYSIPSYD